MKMTSLFILSFAALAADVSHAATVHLTREPRTVHGSTQELIFSEFSHRDIGLLRSTAERITMTVDTVADTGSITELEFGFVLNEATRETTRTLTSTTVTPPTDFPDPPIITTTTDTYTEMVSIDPIPMNVAPRFVSSTVGPISYAGGFQYTFPTTITVSYPESFRLTGTYEFQGPQQTDTIPFDVLYTRVFGSTTVIQSGPAHVFVGTDFPDTGRPGLILNSSVTYRPMTFTLYSGTAGGEPFNVRLRNITIFAVISVPEPTSLCHWAVSLLAVLGTVARRWPRCMS